MIGTEADYAWMRARQVKAKAGVPVKRRNRPIRHGRLSTYVHRKCRCKACCKANSEYWKERKIRVTPEERKADIAYWRSL